MTQPLPRPEYPRPQYQRETWLNLNGPWHFADDPGDSGEERALHEAAPGDLPDVITVPFCRESELSGLHRTDRCLAVWYVREVTIPADWAGQRVLLHFGAADYDTTVWINGAEAGFHRGGHTSFHFEITEHAQPGETCRITVRCRDDWRPHQPRGKQAAQLEPHAVWYTRTTGIWQTVWLEPVPKSYLERPRITPFVETGEFVIEQIVNGFQRGQTVEATLLMEDREIAETAVTLGSDFAPALRLMIPEHDRRLWQPGEPFLYDISLRLRDTDGSLLDEVRSYAGLRGVSLEGQKYLINGKSVFQRLILDQGYYPDGILTAPSDEALVRDIELALEAGFNGARLHQKVFEERFLYHADRLGYLVWGEFPDWCHDQPGGQMVERWNITWVNEWNESVRRDYSHPSIIGWCCMNEQHPMTPDHRQSMADVMTAMFWAAKNFDRTRPVLDASGWSHLVLETDIYDVHTYEQDPEKILADFDRLSEGILEHKYGRGVDDPVPYRGQPYFISEFGGIRNPPEGAPASGAWGYGKRPATMDEFYARFEGLCRVILRHPAMFGYCYTQLTDVPPERNGIVDEHRQPKFDLSKLQAAQNTQAAIEE